MAPAVAPAAKMRRPAAPVGRECGRDLGDAQVSQARLDHHFAGELHAGGVQVQAADRRAVEPAQPAVEVADRDSEEQPADAAQHRIAQVAMQRRHGAGRDAALETIAHHQLVAAPKRLDEGVERAEIVAVVGVAHDHEAAAGGRDAAHQRASVTLVRDRHHAGAETLGNALGPVGAAVVGDQDLSGDLAARHIGQGLLDADADGLGLVETGHENRQFAVGRVRPVGCQGRIEHGELRRGRDCSEAGMLGAIG